jgi:hypothetical protein
MPCNTGTYVGHATADHWLSVLPIPQWSREYDNRHGLRRRLSHWAPLRLSAMMPSPISAPVWMWRTFAANDNGSAARFSRSLTSLQNGTQAQPERDVGRLHRLLDHLH